MESAAFWTYSRTMANGSVYMAVLRRPKMSFPTRTEVFSGSDASGLPDKTFKLAITRPRLVHRRLNSSTHRRGRHPQHARHQASLDPMTAYAPQPLCSI